MFFDEARQKRALAHVIEHGRELQRAGQVLDHLDVGGGGQFIDQLLVLQDKVAQPVGAFLIELVPLHGSEHGAENFRPEDVGEGITAFAPEPEQQLAAGGVLPDQLGQRLLEQVHPTLGNEQAGKLLAQLGGDEIQRAAHNLLPAVGIGLLE